jgi:hypothetical protein
MEHSKVSGARRSNASLPVNLTHMPPTHNTNTRQERAEKHQIHSSAFDVIMQHSYFHFAASSSNCPSVNYVFLDAGNNSQHMYSPSSENFACELKSSITHLVC